MDLGFDYLLYLVELTFSFVLHQIMVFLFSLINYVVCHSLLEMFCLLNQHFRLNNHAVFIINHLFQVNAFFMNCYSFHFHLLVWGDLLTVEFLFNHFVASYLQTRKVHDSFIWNCQFIHLIINRYRNY